MSGVESGFEALIDSRWCFLHQPIWNYTDNSIKCSVVEAVAEWSWLSFRILMALITSVHVLLQRWRGLHKANPAGAALSAGSSVMKKLRLAAAWLPLLVVLLCGSSRWSWARPLQYAPCQFVGAVGSVACVWLFLWVHCTLGSNWSPVPEAKQEHSLVVSGPFRFARHPMYSVFTLWCAPVTALATMNWLVTLATSAALIEFVWRIPQEDAIMHELFGAQFESYRERVGALGPRIFSFRRCRNDGEGLSSKATAASDRIGDATDTHVGGACDLALKDLHTVVCEPQLKDDSTQSGGSGHSDGAIEDVKSDGTMV